MSRGQTGIGIQELFFHVLVANSNPRQQCDMGQCTAQHAQSVERARQGGGEERLMFPTEAGQGAPQAPSFSPDEAAPLQKSYEEESRPGQNWTQPVPG